MDFMVTLKLVTLKYPFLMINGMFLWMYHMNLKTGKSPWISMFFRNFLVGGWYAYPSEKYD